MDERQAQNVSPFHFHLAQVLHFIVRLIPLVLCSNGAMELLELQTHRPVVKSKVLDDPKIFYKKEHCIL